jgi:IS5 family transposase
LEYAQEDSRICGQFVKTNPLRPYSFQAWQKYISRISAGKLEKFTIAVNKIAAGEGLEDFQEFRQDTTAVETNIHYPTNNSDFSPRLARGCTKECEGLLKHLKEETETLEHEKYQKEAEKIYLKINVEKHEEERVKMFKKQLELFMKCIKQVSNVVKERANTG